MADPKIRYDVEANATGTADVARLASELEKLDSTIDPQVAARAQGLATEIRQLGEQSASMERFLRSLSDANEASRALGNAQEALARFERRLVGLEAPTRRQAGELEKLRDAVGSAQAKLTDSTATLSTNRNALEALGLSTADLGATQARLSQSLESARTQAAELGRQYVQTAAAIDKGTAASRESLAATQALVDSAKRAGAAIETAFGATGIRGLNAIEAEIEQTSLALERLQAAARKGDISVEDLGRAAGAAEVKIARLRAEMQQVDAVPNALERAGGKLNDLVGKFGILSATIATVGVALKPAVESFIALETTTRILQSVTGSATQAGQQIEFLRGTAQRSGQDFDSLATSYAKFAASALQGGISIKDTQAAFESVSLAAGNLGIGSEQAGRALEALSQIASKGTVSMEELRGQLGDALPGVLPALARELGLTTAELTKVVETASLAAYEAIPALGRAIGKLGPEAGKPVQGLTAEWNRLKNAIFETTNVVADGAIGRALGAILSVGSTSIKGLALLFGGLSVVVTNLIDRLSTVVAAVASLNFTGLREQIDLLDAEAKQKFERLLSRVQSVAPAASVAAESLLGIATAAGSLGPAGESLAKVALQQQGLVESAGLLTRTRETLAQAAEKEAEANGVLIGLVDDEREARTRALESAQRVAQFRVAAAAAANDEVAALRAAKQAVLDKAGADEQAREGIKKKVQELDKEIAAAQAAAEKSDALASKAQQLAQVAEIAAKTVGNQAAEYDKLRAAVSEADRVYEQTLRRVRQGKADTDELARADNDLVVAKRLLRDAINDQATASEGAIAALKAESAFTKAQIQLDITRLEIKRQDLIRQGALSSAQQIGNRIADLQLKLTEQGTQAKRAEANEIIRSTALQIEQLRVNKQLTPEKELELQTRIRAAQATVLETESSALNEGQRRKEAEAVRNGTAARGEYSGAVGKNTEDIGNNSNAVERNSDSLDKNATAADKAKAARDAYNKLLRDDPSRLVGGNGLGTLDDGSLLAARNARIPSGPAARTTREAGAGQAVNSPGEGWFYTVDPYLWSVKGVDARGNPLPGGWALARGGSSGLAGSNAGFGNLGPGTGLAGIGAVPSAAAAGAAAASSTVPAEATAAPSGDRLLVQLMEARRQVELLTQAQQPTIYMQTVNVGGQQFQLAFANQASAAAAIAAFEAAARAGATGP